MYEQMTFDDLDDWQPGDLRCTGPYFHWCGWVGDDDLPPPDATWEVECWSANGTIIPPTAQCRERWHANDSLGPRASSIGAVWVANAWTRAFVDALISNKPEPQPTVTLGQLFRGELG